VLYGNPREAALKMKGREKGEGALGFGVVNRLFRV
jgi:hypothetical protein